VYFTKANISTKYSGSGVAEGTHGSKDAQTMRSRVRILLLAQKFKYVFLSCTLKVLIHNPRSIACLNMGSIDMCKRRVSRLKEA
jgi:hypothetical protein